MHVLSLLALLYLLCFKGCALIVASVTNEQTLILMLLEYFDRMAAPEPGFVNKNSWVS